MQALRNVCHLRCLLSKKLAQEVVPGRVLVPLKAEEAGMRYRLQDEEEELWRGLKAQMRRAI